MLANVVSWSPSRRLPALPRLSAGRPHARHCHDTQQMDTMPTTGLATAAAGAAEAQSSTPHARLSVVFGVIPLLCNQCAVVGQLASAQGAICTTAQHLFPSYAAHGPSSPSLAAAHKCCIYRTAGHRPPVGLHPLQHQHPTTGRGSRSASLPAQQLRGCPRRQQSRLPLVPWGT